MKFVSGIAGLLTLLVTIGWTNHAHGYLPFRNCQSNEVISKVSCTGLNTQIDLNIAGIAGARDYVNVEAEIVFNQIPVQVKGHCSYSFTSDFGTSYYFTLPINNEAVRIVFESNNLTTVDAYTDLSVPSSAHPAIALKCVAK